MVINPVIIIPCFRHGDRLRENLADIEKYNVPVIIVDDGNPVPLKELLEGEKSEKTVIIRSENNGGKGSAMKLGFKFALESGFSHGLQIDADNQLDPHAIPEFLRLAEKHPGALVAGKPEYQNVPLGRFLARYITHFWVAVELGKCRIIDSMCGLRVYPLGPACRIMNTRHVGSHMSFDTEIMIRLYWFGCDIIQHPVNVSYPAGGISNFRSFRDNLEISVCHTRLCFEKMLHPVKISRREYL